MSWYSDIPPYYVVLHPVGAVLFCYALVRSMVLTLVRGGVEWRGTLYSLDELRELSARGATVDLALGMLKKSIKQICRGLKPAREDNNKLLVRRG